VAHSAGRASLHLTGFVSCGRRMSATGAESRAESRTAYFQGLLPIIRIARSILFGDHARGVLGHNPSLGT
jgi:hypothetical protein